MSKKLAPTGVERDAARTLEALAGMTPADAAVQRDTERYTLRVQFALARLEELKRDAANAGGVFAAARVDIARTILETHVRTSAEHITRTLLTKRRAPKLRTTTAAVDEAVELASATLRAA